MESSGSEQTLLVAELCHIKELVRQLEDHMDQPSPIEFCKSLTPVINLSLEKSISMMKMRSSTCRNSGMESPCEGETSDQPFKNHDPREMSKKRKTLPKWRNQVKVSSGCGVESPLDDGYSWRKYGQKDILGAKYPRSYYRCTHRNTRGCLATKQVQRTDENPFIFEVTYHGTHICHQRPKSVPEAATGKKEQQQQQQQQQHKCQQPDLFQSFRASLEVKVEDLDSEAKERNPISFSLSSTLAGSSEMPDDDIFFSPLTRDGFSQFLLPVPSESNYYSMSACQMSSCRGGSGLRKSESDLTEVISAATSANDSLMADMDFMLEQFNFDPGFFQLDASSFFP